MEEAKFQSISKKLSNDIIDLITNEYDEREVPDAIEWRLISLNAIIQAFGGTFSAVVLFKKLSDESRDVMWKNLMEILESGYKKKFNL